MDLDLIADSELPRDGGVLGARLPVDDLPAHVRGRGHPVHVDHVVLPLDAAGGGVGMVVIVAVVLVGVTNVPVFMLTAALADQRRRQQLHPALWAVAGLVTHDLGMHRTRVRATWGRLGKQLTPQRGQLAGSSLTTSGCMGQT